MNYMLKLLMRQSGKYKQLYSIIKLNFNVLGWYMAIF